LQAGCEIALYERIILPQRNNL